MNKFKTSLNLEQLGDRALPATGLGSLGTEPADLTPIIRADLAALHQAQRQLAADRVALAPILRQDRIDLARAIRSGNASAIQAARAQLAADKATLSADIAAVKAATEKLLADLKGL